MAIQFATRVEDGVLMVAASGFDESPQEVQAYGVALVEAARAAGTDLVYCDERELDYRISIGDAFAAAKFIANLTRAARRVGLVCAPRHFQAGDFWASVASNRGLKVRVFTEPARALAWVKTGNDALQVVV